MTPSDTISSSGDRFTMVDKMAGFLAAGSLALSGLSLAVTPALLVPVAAILAFAAGRMSARNEKLATFAALVSFLAFVVGMTLAVITEHSLL